ncbi:MAG: hypothetical protein PCFJNLEI_02168 [Verrucomicrobiae bacterium]|nr:hypothetical protein [Verrucomicrobiae bacterium]
MKIRQTISVIAAVVVAIAGSHAQNNSYISGSSGIWQTGGNWSLGVAPDGTQTAVFLTNATTKTVTIDSSTPSGNLTISNLTVSAPVGSENTLFINGNSLEIIRTFTNFARGFVTVTNGGFHVKNGTVIEGRLDIQQGASMTSTGTFLISRATGASGTMTISGGDVRINGSGSEMAVGRSGTGWLQVSNGTLVIQNGSLVVGRQTGGGPGTGTISVNGGVVTNTVATTIGSNHGNLLISGGHWVQQADIILGQGGGGAPGQGTLSVQGGTYQQTSGAMTIGVQSNPQFGRVIVGGGNLILSGSGTMIVGSTGQGTLLVTNGHLNVSASGGIFVGRGGGTTPGFGTVTVSGGVVTNTAALQFGFIGASQGTFIQSGGTWIQQGDVTLGAGGTAVASMIVTGGVLRSTGNVTLGSATGTAGSLTVGGTGQMFITNSAGTAQLLVGSSGNGTLTLNGGTLTVNNLRNTGNGTILGAGGRVIVTGVFTNTGTLNLSNAHGTFNSTVVNAGTWITDPSTFTFNGIYSNAPAATFLTANDTYIFRSNFINQITDPTKYDTLTTKFIFNGGSGTQLYQVAGLSLGAPGTSSLAPDPVFFTHVGNSYSTNGFEYLSLGSLPAFTNNFSLQTLAIGANTTLRLADNVFGGATSGLYVTSLALDAGAQLIISNNVHLYFRGTNGVTGLAFGDWTDNLGANVLLLPGAGFHQLVVIPEPSTLLLLVTGGWVLYWRRRKSDKGVA